MLQKFFDWVAAHPLYFVLSVFALLLLLFVAANGIGRSIEVFRERKADAVQAAHEKEVSSLKADREAAIRRADIAEANALLKETEAKELKDLIAANGGKIETAAAKLQKDIENAKANAGSCANDPDPRGCTCKKLQSAGFDCR